LDEEGQSMNKPTAHAAAGFPGQGETPPMLAYKQRILIAEDSATSRKQLQQLLEAELGIVIATASDGREALEMRTASPYSVVVTDLQMPKVSGMVLIEEVKKRRLPVAVVVTIGCGSIGEAEERQGHSVVFRYSYS
jgi:DNA-binding NtrC family response regulator